MSVFNLPLYPEVGCSLNGNMPSYQKTKKKKEKKQKEKKEGKKTLDFY